MEWIMRYFCEGHEDNYPEHILTIDLSSSFHLQNPWTNGMTMATNGWN